MSLFLICSLRAASIQGLDCPVHGTPGSAQLLKLLLCCLEVLPGKEGNHVLEVVLVSFPGPLKLGLVFPHLDVVVPEDSQKMVEVPQQVAEAEVNHIALKQARLVAREQ